jgi:hypothetical protein
MKRNSTRSKSSRDGGGFIAIPWQVIDSPAYQATSVHAKALLIEIARQYSGSNNGALLCSRAYMLTRGWNSADMLTKAKRELLEAELIFETVKGARPNKASWYALTWQALDKLSGYDSGAGAFERGAYRKKQPIKNASLKPSHGIGKAFLAPWDGTDTRLFVPSHGAIRTN